MKRIFITMFAFALGFGIFAGTVNAQVSFNTSQQDRATIRVNNNSVNPNTSACWVTAIPGTNNNCSSPIMQPGQVVSVAIYYHNTGTTASNNTMLRITSPQSMGAQMTHTISGNVAGMAYGSSTVQISSAQTLTYVPGSAKWFPNQTTVGQSLPNGQSGTELFGAGLNIGTINPGWASQGSVVFHYVVGNNVQQQAFACNDGVDNDADGYIDMQDAGCSSGSDTDEYNYVQPQVYACNDGYDNDGDGRIDMNDLGCSSSFDTDEYNYVQPQVYACNDGYDNDADGRVDMQDAGCSSVYDTDEYNYVQQNIAPDVTTVIATSVGQSSARLNGVVSISSSSATTAWFEYGTTQNFGSTTATQVVGSSGVLSFSQPIYNLSQNTVYYFRAVAQNAYGTDYGQIMSFTTSNQPVVITPTTNTTTVITTGSGSGSNLVMLKITPDYEIVNIKDVINFTVEYKNISNKTLSNTIIRVILPKEIAFNKSTKGTFSTDNGLTVELGTLAPGDNGTFSVQGTVLNSAKDRDLLVTTAHMVFTVLSSGAQEDAIAYALNTVSKNSNSSLVGLSLFGADIFPDTLAGWLLLILIILALILVIRKLAEKKPVDTVSHTISQTEQTSIPTNLPR